MNDAQGDRQSARAQFGKNAESYLTSQAHARPDELGQIVQEHKLYGDRVADVGTGAGHVAYALAPFCTTVIAVDMVPEMLHIVERESKTRSLSNIKTQLSTAEDLPFPDEDLDGIACRTAAHHFTDVEAFVGSSARCLKPGGWLFVQDTISPEDDDLASELDAFERLRDPSHVWNLKETQWRSLVLHAGFSIDSCEKGVMAIDQTQWIERMQVPHEERPRLVNMIRNASPALREVIHPRKENEAEWFNLPKITLIARKKPT